MALGDGALFLVKLGLNSAYLSVIVLSNEVSANILFRPSLGPVRKSPDLLELRVQRWMVLEQPLAQENFKAFAFVVASLRECGSKVFKSSHMIFRILKTSKSTYRNLIMHEQKRAFERH